MYYKRLISNLLMQITEQRPLVYLNGGRQTGKSTLVQKTDLQKDTNYITLDSPFILAAAKNNPENFILSLPKNKINILDEIQLAKEVFPILKINIDNKRLKNKSTDLLYLLTGSANLMALPSLAQHLVGRMSIITLYPFSSGEYAKTNKNFIESLFSDKLQYFKYSGKYNLLDIIKNSTYPEMVVNKKINRIKWLDDYLTTILQRDIKNIMDIRNPEKIVMLLSFFATRAGGLLNNNSVMSEAGLDNKTYDRYKAAVINTFLAFEIKPWMPVTKINKRFTKSSKLYFTDTNMLCYVLRQDIKDIFAKNKVIFGNIFENFIATEIIKNISAVTDMTVSHFRTVDNKEVDFVIERTNGDILGIEVKAAVSAGYNDIKGLLELQKHSGDKFKKGIVLYTGSEIVPLADKIWAVPVCYLWKK